MADALATMTPEQLSMIPAGTPPPGVIPNFIDPPTSAPVLIAVGTVLMAIMLLFAGIRFYVKVIIRRKVTPDDWTTLAAVIGTCWYYGICIHAVTRAKFGTHMWDISVAHTLSDDFLIASFFTNWPSGLVRAFAKSSFLLMYLQLFSPWAWLRRSAFVGMFLNWGFYTSVIIASIYYQAPNPGQTWQEGFTNERYNKSFYMTLPIASGSLILNTYIFVLPLIAVWNLRLSPRKKIGVMAVFATGLIACVASSLSIYIKHKLNSHLDDYTYWVYIVLLMALVEMCNKSGGFGNWGVSALSSLRSLLRHGKSSNASRDFETSWKSSRSNAMAKNALR
ncbi:Uu.00g034820.m01.CDS01 [Anthostomella pinea]|uniref:Uu.00g034820.m01.CDS01 n=1 Tax=Anthostomella pinea TaxID=933095 RepID=A0AAI8V950_9PEZI|nr:Uu.00g034820.m01.CDS01 [Anthostomella pinea]